MSQLAANLIRRREYIGYSRAGLAIASGVDAQMIVMIEAGRVTHPADGILDALALALHTDVPDLVGDPAAEARSRFELIRGGRAAQPPAAAGPEVA